MAIAADTLSPTRVISSPYLLTQRHEVNTRAAATSRRRHTAKIRPYEFHAILALVSYRRRRHRAPTAPIPQPGCTIDLPTRCDEDALMTMPFIDARPEMTPAKFIITPRWYERTRRLKRCVLLNDDGRDDVSPHLVTRC